MSKGKIRGPNFELSDKIQLLEIIEKYRGVECKRTDHASSREKDRLWNMIKDEYNNISRLPRTQVQLKHAWENMKRTARKEAAERKSDNTDNTQLTVPPPHETSDLLLNRVTDLLGSNLEETWPASLSGIDQDNTNGSRSESNIPSSATKSDAEPPTAYNPLDFCATDFDPNGSDFSMDNMDPENVFVKVEVEDSRNDGSHDSLYDNSSFDQKRRRKEPYFSKDEKQLLVELANDRPILYSTSYETYSKREKTWEELTVAFNKRNKLRSPLAEPRSVKFLHNTWFTLRQQAKKACANKTVNNDTASNPIPNWNPTLTEIEEITIPVEPSHKNELDESQLFKFDTEEARILLKQRTKHEKRLFQLKEKKEMLKIQLLEMEIQQRKRMWSDATT